MPFAAGTFSRVYDWTTDRDNLVNITASRMDTEMDGIATGLSTALTRDGQSLITAPIPFNSQKITGLGNASADADLLNRTTADGRYVSTTGLAHELIQTQTVSAVSQIVFSTGLTSYQSYLLCGSLYGSQAFGSGIQLQTSMDGGASYYSTAGMYMFSYMYVQSNSAVKGAGSSSTTAGAYYIAEYGSNSYIGSTVFRYHWQNGEIVDANGFNALVGAAAFTDPSNVRKLWRFGGVSNATRGAFNAFRIFPLTGTLTGKVSIYGIRQ